jgi:hypothetical protein
MALVARGPTTFETAAQQQVIYFDDLDDIDTYVDHPNS